MLWSLAKFCVLLAVVGLIVVIGAFLLIARIATLDTRPSSVLFRQYVADPVPKSVTGLRIDHPGTNDYVFRFAVNEADFQTIRKSHPFREGENLRCLGGIDWDWKGWNRNTPGVPFVNGIAIYLPTPGVRVPAWFDLPSWRDPEIWGLERTNDQRTETQVLVYNRDLGQAYFIATTLYYGH
jgi:hypothetical protein